MSKVISTGQLAETITDMLNKWDEEVEEKIEKALDTTAKSGAQKLKPVSPKNTGKYASGWTKKKQSKGQIIYNKKRPGLTHLLERGHAKRGGGRVPPQKHIEPVEELANKEIVDEIKKIIS